MLPGLKGCEKGGGFKGGFFVVVGIDDGSGLAPSLRAGPDADGLPCCGHSFLRWGSKLPCEDVVSVASCLWSLDQVPLQRDWGIVAISLAFKYFGRPGNREVSLLDTNFLAPAKVDRPKQRLAY